MFNVKRRASHDGTLDDERATHKPTTTTTTTTATTTQQQTNKKHNKHTTQPTHQHEHNNDEEQQVNEQGTFEILSTARIKQIMQAATAVQQDIANYGCSLQ